MAKNKSKLSRRQQNYKAAYIFAVIFTVITAFAIIPLIWTIAMTLRIKKTYLTNDDSSHIVLGICSLFFLSLISGIIILCSEASSTKIED
ncbi:MAG: hypothetical protein LBB39_00860 [Mycoplasmataceae bacterium]|jgi:hypothetical protein|nr:hypothetical protein [Mycoplasmataceae bacterium]